MKKLIGSVVVISVLVALVVETRLYLKNCVESFLASVEYVSQAPTEREAAFSDMVGKFSKKRKVLALFVHGEYLSEIGQKLSELSKMYSAGADGKELRDGLTEVSVLLNEMYSSGVVSFDTVF